MIVVVVVVVGDEVPYLSLALLIVHDGFTHGIYIYIDDDE